MLRHRLSPRALLALGALALPADLIPSGAIERLAGLPSALPPACTEGAIEVRLAREGEESERVDFEAAISVAGGGRKVLESCWAAGVESDEWSWTPAWRGIDRFFRAWMDPSSLLHEAVQVVWLEFDAGAAPGDPPEPFLIFTLDPERFHPEGLALRGPLEECTLEGLDLLSGGLSREVRDGVRRFLAAMPPYAQLLHLALRPGDTSGGARLIVRFPWERMPEFLEKLDWPGSGEDLASWLERYFGHTLVHSFNFDVGARIGPRIGAEFHFRSSPLRDPRWLDLFELLEQDGACCATKREQIAGWPSTVETNAAVATIPGLDLVRDLLVKVVHEAGEDVSAKAYLTYAPRVLA